MVLISSRFDPRREPGTSTLISSASFSGKSYLFYAYLKEFEAFHQQAPSEVVLFASAVGKPEYIEVAKRYSTPKSKMFINGVLDVISKELSDSGVIKKSGRGLIDNK